MTDYNENRETPVSEQHSVTGRHLAPEPKPENISVSDTLTKEIPQEIPETWTKTHISHINFNYSDQPEADMHKRDSSPSKQQIASSKESVPTIAAIVIGALLAACLLFMILMLIKLNVLPFALLITVCTVLTVLCILTVILVWDTRKPVRFAIGIFLAVILIAGLIYASVLLRQAWTTALKVTTVEKEVTLVGVYVCTDDEIDSINDMVGSSFGILKEQDRDEVNEALKQIANEIKSNITVYEYDTVPDLISALIAGSVRGAVFKSYHVDMLLSLEQEEYSAMIGKINQLCTYTVEKMSEDDISSDVVDVGESPIKDREPEEITADNHTISVYISGIDTFGSVNVQSRSDVNILAFANTETHQILLVTTPRDYYVYTPVSGQYRDKLTHAGLWGPDCSKGALEYLYDTNVDYYFRVNFSGFVDIVNAVGGVEFSYSDDEPAWHLDGDSALTIARDRTWCGGDGNRGINQMRIIKALLNKILSTELIYSFCDIMEAVGDSFQTTVPYETISGLVKEQISSNPTWEIISYAVSGTGTSDIPFAFIYYGNEGGMYAYVCEPDYSTVKTAHDLITAMKNNERIYDPN